MPSDLLDVLREAGLRLLIAAAVLVAGRILAGLGRRLVNHLTSNPRVARNLGPSMRSFLAQAFYVVVLVLAVVISLWVLGVPETVLAWGLGIVLVVFAVALSRSLANLAATVIFLVFRAFRLGDDIETMGQRGLVEDIQLFHTVLRRFDHSVVSLPNAGVQEAGLVNHSRTGVNWAPIDVTVSYGQDLVLVRDTILRVLEESPLVRDTPPPDVVVLQLGTQGVVFQAQPTVGHDDLWPALSELQHQIATRLVGEGVDLAVPPELPVRLRHATERAPADPPD